MVTITKMTKGTFLDWRSRKARDPARDGTVAISQSCLKEEYHIKISRQTFFYLLHCWWLDTNWISTFRSHTQVLCLNKPLHIMQVLIALMNLLNKVSCATVQTWDLSKTLPKAQRTRGLSSYHKLLHKSWSNNFRILIKH